MIHQTEQSLNKIKRISKSTEEHIKDILKLKQASKNIASKLINNNFDEQDLQQDLEFFATAYSFTFSETPDKNTNSKKRQAKKSIEQNFAVNQQTFTKMLQKLREDF